MSGDTSGAWKSISSIDSKTNARSYSVTVRRIVAICDLRAHTDALMLSGLSSRCYRPPELEGVDGSLCDEDRLFQGDGRYTGCPRHPVRALRILVHRACRERGGPFFGVCQRRHLLIGLQLTIKLLIRSIQTPQLLELSGIGDRKILEPLGIPTQLDLPGVGNNAQEHIAHNGLAYCRRLL